jgi:hypothetical protein
VLTQLNRTFCEGNGSTLAICVYENKKSLLFCFRIQSLLQITLNNFILSPIPSVKVFLLLTCFTFTHSLTQLQIYFLTKHFQPTPTLLVYWSLLATGLTHTISRNIIALALRYLSLFLKICRRFILGILGRITGLQERTKCS